MARRHLYEIGEDFMHGTGHGVGHFLNWHESPMGISYGRYKPFEKNTNTTIEPGFYK